MKQKKIAENRYSIVMDSPLGRLGIRVLDRQIHHIGYLEDEVRLQAPTSAFERRVVQQLEKYFYNPAAGFNVSFTLAGTPFQRRVWMALTGIPAGETVTYGELAASLGSGARAVGNACRHNPVSIIVPCHRVVAAHSLGGYSGSTTGPLLDRKRWLLAHENGPHAPLKKPAVAPSNPLHPENHRNSSA